MTVDTEVYEPHPDQPGYRRRARVKTVHEVCDELVTELGNYPAGGEEGLHVYPTVGADTLWPEGQIAVFPVTGGSEGHYTHVEVLAGEQRHLLMLAKTFDGFDAAWRFSRRLALLLSV